MRTSVSPLTLKLKLLVVAALAMSAGSLFAQDSELTNYKSGIDVYWGVGDGSDKGTAYYEEYFYHDKLLDDHKVVYIKSTTVINMRHNDRNNINYHSTQGGRQIVGANGKDGTPNTGDEGIIRYKIGRDRNYSLKWSVNSAGSDSAFTLPAYSGPFTLASQNYEAGVPVVGSTGGNGGNVSSKSAYYYRGILDSFGDEWHVLAYADDDGPFHKANNAAGGPFVDQAFYATDGKTVLLVVNPKTPCLTARAVGSGQFYTTPPKAYFTPKIVSQTTYISGTVNIELRDINGNNVFYRINGGSYTNAGSSTVALNQSNFNTGSNTLEYYYQGNAAYVKTRIVVKDPSFPSASESHGNFLWEDSTGYSKVLSRITRNPYLAYYSNYKTRGDFSGQIDWDAKAGKGRRDIGGYYHLENAFVAKVEGFNFTRTGATKSHGRYAKEMLLESSRNLDPIGFELQHSADSLPNRELHYRGYYDALPMLKGIFAYDLMVANFRSNQVSGGITAIEDYFIRDKFASFAFEAMQWGADMTLLGAPGMWGGARMMAGVSIALVMPEYSTPYYGTSGFGSVQTTYPLAPYQNDQLTWKQALFNGDQPKKGYPNLTWYTGISDNGNDSLLMAQGQLWGPNAYPLGTWLDKSAYYTSGLVGIHLQVWANMAKLWGGKTDPRLDISFDSASKGSFIGAKDPYPQAAGRVTNLLVMNSRWPNTIVNSLAYIQSLPSTDSSSDDKAMQDAGIFGFAWFDDQVGGSVIPPPPTIVAPSNAKVGITVTTP